MNQNGARGTGSVHGDAEEAKIRIVSPRWRAVGRRRGRGRRRGYGSHTDSRWRAVPEGGGDVGRDPAGEPGECIAGTDIAGTDIAETEPRGTIRRRALLLVIVSKSLPQCSRNATTMKRPSRTALPTRRQARRRASPKVDGNGRNAREKCQTEIPSVPAGSHTGNALLRAGCCTEQIRTRRAPGCSQLYLTRFRDPRSQSLLIACGKDPRR